MKKSLIFTIVTCSIAVVLLSGVLAYGLISDGFEKIWRDDDIVDIDTSDDYDEFEGVDDDGFDEFADPEEDSDADSDELENKTLAKATSTKNGVEYEVIWKDAEYVSSLDISWISSKVDVKIVEDGSTIRIVETANRKLKSDEQMRISQAGGKLQIKWNNQLFNFFMTKNHRKSLLVEIPKNVATKMRDIEVSSVSGDIDIDNFVCDNLEVSTTSGNMEIPAIKVAEEATFSTVSGKIDVNGLECEKLLANSTSGDINLENMTAETVSANGVSGAVKFSGKAKDIAASVVSASVDFSLAEAPQKADLNSVSGDLTILFPKASGFAVDYSTVSGEFSSDYEVSGTQGKMSGDLTHGNASEGAPKLDFSTTSGDMTIKSK